MKKRNHIKKISDYAMVGGLGALLVTGLVGCGDNSNDKNQQQKQVLNDAAKKEGAFVIVEESADKKYKIVDEYPATKTTIILRKQDGTEKILTKEEIDALVIEENKKIDAGTSPLTNPQAQVTDGGMGLGGVLLSSIAGAVVGSWIGNKLFNNQNFQNQRQTQYKSPQTYSRTQSSFTKAPASTGMGSSTNTKSGFFGGNNGSTTTATGASSTSGTSSSTPSTTKSSSFSSPSSSSVGG